MRKTLFLAAGLLMLAFSARIQAQETIADVLAAAGVSASANGMAPAATLDSYNRTSDESEVTSRAATSIGQLDTHIHLSNHSYCYGWNYTTKWQWTGFGTDQNAHDADFGQYSSKPRNLDFRSNAPNGMAKSSCPMLFAGTMTAATWNPQVTTAAK